MIEFFIILIGITTVFISKAIFQKWYNHLAIYSVIWCGMLLFFQMRLLKYYPLVNFTWFIIASAFLAFTIGCLTVYFARKVKTPQPYLSDGHQTAILADGGQTIKVAIYICGIIGLLTAFQDWYVLIHKFGSITNVLLSANEIYRLRVEGKMYTGIPYLQTFSQVGICLAGFYTAYKNKLTFPAVIPLAAAIIKSLSQFGRIGMLIAIVNFIASFFISKYYFDMTRPKGKSNFKLLIAVIIVFTFVVASASIVKTFRGSYEKYKGANRELTTLKDNPFLSPSVYLYLSSHVGVLNMYFIKDVEHYRFGENTFAAWYNLLSKFSIVEKVPFDLQGYYIPMWTNTGTYLRDLHGDYGFLGVILGPYLIGLFTTIFWFRFFTTGKLKYFVLLVYFLQVITISFFSLITRGAEWFLSMFLLLYFLPRMEKMALARSEKNKKLGANTI